MKYLTTLIILLILLSSCSKQEPFVPPNLLSDNKNLYNLLFVFEDSTSDEDRNDFVSYVMIENQKFNEVRIVNADMYNLELKKTPAVIVIDDKGIVLTAYDKQRAKEFLSKES